MCKISLFILLILFSSCVTRKECRLELIRQQHPELSECLSNYPSLTMTFMKTIAQLEEETGHYK